jgi:hypothetical protein
VKLWLSIDHPPVINVCRVYDDSYRCEAEVDTFKIDEEWLANYQRISDEYWTAQLKLDAIYRKAVGLDKYRPFVRPAPIID